MNKQKRAWKRTINRGMMKQATFMLLVLGTLFTGSLSAEAESENPFGFETNKHPLEYEYCKKEPGLFRGHGYTCSSAPRPHPDIKEYRLQFVEDVGVCAIVAALDEVLLRDIENRVEQFKGQLAKKYGPAAIPTEEENRDTVTGFNWQILRYYWNSNGGFQGLGDVKRIQIRAYSTDKDPTYELLKDDPNKNWVTISFGLVTSDACLKKIDDKADRAF